MAKRVDRVTLKGVLDDVRLIEEKDSVQVFDLLEIIRSFDGEEVTITITNEKNLPAAGEE